MTLYQPDEGNDLFISFKRDEPGAYRQVFDLYNKRLFYLALNITDNKEEAQDIVQETFIKLIERRSAIENMPNLVGFLMVTTRNAALNYVLRERAKRSARPIADDIPAHDENVQEREMYRAWLLGEVYKEIENLSEGKKAVVKLLIKGKSTAEIASILGCSQQTVLNQKSSAIKQLSGRLPKDALLMIYLLLSIIKD